MKILNNQKGIGLVETLVAIIVISIVAVAGFEVFSSVRALQVEREIRLTAVNLAAAQMEDLKETAKSGITDSALDPPVAPATSRPCTLTTFPNGFNAADVTYNVQDIFYWDDFPAPDVDCKVITVTVTYPTKATADPRSVQLTGFVVE